MFYTVFKPFSDSRPFPLKIFVSGNAALWLSSMLAFSWWEEQLFGDSRQERIATFVRDGNEADIVIAVGSYKTPPGKARHYWFLSLASGLTFPSKVSAEPVVVLLKWLPSPHPLLYAFLRHELGHALLGLGDNPDVESVMCCEGKDLVTLRDYAAAICYLSDHGVSVP